MVDIINEIKSNSIYDLDYAALLRNKRKMDQTRTKVGRVKCTIGKFGLILDYMIDITEFDFFYPKKKKTEEVINLYI